MTNNTIQVSTSNTIEELRQKLNDISLSVGDSNTLVSSLSSGYSDIGSIRLADNNNFLASSNFQLNTETVFDGQNNSYNKGRIALYINDVIQEQGLAANQYYVPLQTFVINLTGNSTDWSSYIGNTVTQGASSWTGGELVYADTNILVIYGSSSGFSLTNQISTNGAASINLCLKLSELITASIISLSFRPSFFTILFNSPTPIFARFFPAGKIQKYPGLISSM